MISDKDSLIYQAIMEEEGNFEKAISAWCLLHSSEYSKQQLEPCKKVMISCGDINFELIFENIPTAVFESLPLSDHQLYEHQDGIAIFEDKCRKAAQIINTNLPEKLRYLTSFLKVVVPVYLQPSTKKQLITSLTIPDLPFTSFISENAFIHLAPDILSYGFDEYYLSENLVHEMVHNMVNILLLESDVLVPDYSSALSNKVRIPWRKNSEIRNQYWELDRMIHAYCVYAHLSAYRAVLCQQEHSGVTHQMVKASIEKTNFLRKRILENKCYLTGYGVEFIHSFQNELIPA